MARKFPWLIVLTVTLAGCANKEKQRAETLKAFQAGEQHARDQLQAQQSTVTFRGPVRHPVVPWREGLMLSQALVTAEYTAATDPRTIMLVRQGRVFQINPQRLAVGKEDVELHAGDVIEVVR